MSVAINVYDLVTTLWYFTVLFITTAGMAWLGHVAPLFTREIANQQLELQLGSN